MDNQSLTAAHQLAASRRFLTQEDVDDIQRLVEGMPKRPINVVDLGAGSGTTALAVFCIRSKRLKVWTVDIDAQALSWAEANLKGFGYLYLGRWFPKLISSHKLALDWEEGKVDLLLHDADHSEKAVYRDILAWLPHMAANGIIWVHDYKGDYPGVARAIERLPLKPLPVSGMGWAGKVNV